MTERIRLNIKGRRADADAQLRARGLLPLGSIREFPPTRHNHSDWLSVAEVDTKDAKQIGAWFNEGTAARQSGKPSAGTLLAYTYLRR